MSTRLYLPDSTPRAIFQIVHGMCEHIGRYDGFAKYLNQHGLAVYLCDLVGHGDDCPTLGYAEGDMWELTLTQLRNANGELRKKFPGIPLILFGHSYGSFLTQRLLPEIGADAYILSGSSRHTDAEKMSRLRDMAAALPPDAKATELAQLTFVAYNKKFEAEGINAWLTRDSAEVAKYNADPLCGFVTSVNFYRGMYGGLVQLCDPAFPPSGTAPVLVLSGDQDPVGNFGEGVKELHRMYLDRGYRASLKLYESGRHEMLNEVNRMEVYEAILEFINSVV